MQFRLPFVGEIVCSRAGRCSGCAWWTVLMVKKEQSRSALDLTATVAARSILRPPRLLRMAAARRLVNHSP
jgi:hypothetical protein